MAFELDKKFRASGNRKCVALLISGHSGDEQARYKEFLEDYFKMKTAEFPAAHVFMLFGEDRILSHRDIIVDKKYYSFSQIPAVIASVGGIGTYFSQVEGFGNNLLEMLAAGLPVLGIQSPGVGDTIADGITGLLAEEEDLAVFTARMVRLVTEHQQRCEMGQRARQAAEDYAIEHTTQMMLERYQTVVRKAGGRKHGLRARLQRFLDRWYIR